MLIEKIRELFEKFIKLKTSIKAVNSKPNSDKDFTTYCTSQSQ
jgi:hypothetical protein